MTITSYNRINIFLAIGGNCVIYSRAAGSATRRHALFMMVCIDFMYGDCVAMRVIPIRTDLHIGRRLGGAGADVGSRGDIVNTMVVRATISRPYGVVI